MKITKFTSFNEEAVVKGCQKLDESSQKQLYDYFAPRMFALCLRYVNDYHAAEDVLQDGFVKLFRNIRNFRNEGSFEGWVRRIFVNVSIEYFRRSVRVYPLIDENDHEVDIEDSSHFDHLDLQALLNMIQELSPGYRTIFNLYAVEGYSHKEISEMLDVSEGTSKSQLARARSILKKKVIAAQKIPSKVASK